MVAVLDMAAYRPAVITPAQIRAARALLGWRQADLARDAGISAIAVKNIERGATDPRTSTMNKIQQTFDRAGVMFLDIDDIRDGGPGVRLKRQVS